MFDIEKQLKMLGAKKHRPDETLRQRTIEKLRASAEKGVPHKSLTWRWAAASAVVAVLAAVLIFAILPAQQTSYFTIDINPSIGIETDANGVILSVKAQNSDAEALLADLDLTGMSFIDALSCVVQAAEEQGYLKDNGHVLVAHFGVSAQVTEAQVEAAVLESTHKQVNVLLLQSDRSDYEDTAQTHQSAGISLLMRNAQQLGIEDVDIDDIIQTIKKNNNAGGNSSSHRQNTPSATAEATESDDQGNENANSPEKTNNGNHGSGNNGNGNSSNNGNGNSSNPEQSDKEEKQSADSED